MQKIELYHNKGFDMLKLGCTLHLSAQFYQCKFFSKQSDKYLISKVWEDMIGGPSIVFTCKVAVEETHIRKSANVCKSIVATHASQF